MDLEESFNKIFIEYKDHCLKQDRKIIVNLSMSSLRPINQMSEDKEKVVEKLVTAPPLLQHTLCPLLFLFFLFPPLFYLSSSFSRSITLFSCLSLFLSFSLSMTSFSSILSPFYPHLPFSPLSFLYYIIFLLSLLTQCIDQLL